MEGQAVSTAYMPKAKTVEYETPTSVFDALDAEFGPFTLDPACRISHHSAQKLLQRGGMLYVPEDEPEANPILWQATRSDLVVIDGLLNDWAGIVWLNPPYGREMPKWIEKAVREVEAGRAKRVVALIPSRTDTKMWQKYILKQTGPFRGVNYCVDAHATIDLVRFLPGRIKFGGANDPAPFPSAVVVWTSPDYSEDEG